jgi:hypothetical protein
LAATTAACFVLIAPLGAHAQGAPTVSLEASTADRCMTPTPGGRAKPVYPSWELDHKQGANVNAEFVFEAPDRAPKVRFLAPEPEASFDRAVQDYAAQLRLPCMAPGSAPVVLRQGFDFVPNDGRKVAWTAMSDPADAAREKTLACLLHPTAYDDRVRYPNDMLRAQRAGVVVMRLTFTPGTPEPVVEVLYDGDGKSFATAVRGYATAVRLPCQHEGTPVPAIMRFRFVLEGDEAPKYVLNDLGLKDFLSAAKAVTPGSAYFDTTTMKCPFDVRFTLKQPFGPNRVEVLEEDVPARRAFADWLATREFELQPRSAANLYGQSMTIHIPCAKIDL